MDDIAIKTERIILVLTNCIEELKLKSIEINLLSTYGEAFRMILNKILKEIEHQKKHYLLERLQFAGLIY